MFIRLIKGRKQAIAEAYGKSAAAKHSLYCVSGEELAKSYRPFIGIVEGKVKNGGSSKILTNVENEIVGPVKELIKAGADIRHIDREFLKRCVIYDDNIAYFSIVEPVVDGKPLHTVDDAEGDDLWIASSDAHVVQAAKKQFMRDWDAAVLANDRLNELENGEEIEESRIIKNNDEAIRIYKWVAKSATKEVMYLLPSARALIRVFSSGIINYLVESSRKGAKVRILCPVNNENLGIVGKIRESSNSIEIRDHEPLFTTVLISDRRHVFTSELRNDAAFDLRSALSFSKYSNSVPTVQSYITLFESLWRQKQLYEQLKEMDKIKEEFINVAAHELRTPILPLLLTAESLADEVTDKRLKERIDIIARNARRLNRLTNDILDISRIESNSFVLQKEKVDLGKLLADAVRDARHRAISKPDLKIELDLHLPTTNHEVLIDSQRINQVLTNLLENSINFTDSGSITVVVSQSGALKNVIEVSIKDTGKGIDESIKDKLFQKFVTKSNRQKGTGIGLFLCKKIIEAHGGTIHGENNNDGGATFSFTLPVISV